MIPIEKGGLAAVLPITTWLSPSLGVAMGLGLMGGWLARVGVSRRDRKSWTEIRGDALVMLLFSGGSILTTLFFARLTEADELTMAGIAFVVALSGEDAFQLLKKFLFAPVLAAIRKTEGDEK